jgi:hypothetical protein
MLKQQPSNAKARKRLAAPMIDRDKLRTAVRRLGDEYIFYMLDEAIDLLPPAKLVKLVGLPRRPATTTRCGCRGEDSIG